ncbi:MAG: hypothetical protein AB7O96_16155 [Pseudobdellovibrionaceae bacterium]
MIASVILIFRVSESKEQAGILTGSLFLLLPALVIFNELRKKTQRSAFYTSLIFLAFAALPIFFLRISNMGVPFAELSLMSIPAPWLHRTGNGLYLVMMIGTAANWQRSRHSLKKFI